MLTASYGHGSSGDRGVINMHRTWVITPAVVATVLAAQLGSTTPADSQAAIDLAVSSALAQADAAVDWECAMPHRDTSRRAARSMALGAVLPFAENATPGPGQIGTAEGETKTIPGFGTGPGEKSATQVTGTLAGPDTSDTYAIPLRAGDVFSATVRGTGGTLEVRDPSGVLVEGSSIDRSGIYPEASPLLGGGNASVDHVAAVSGIHTLTVRRSKTTAALDPSTPAPSSLSPSPAPGAPVPAAPVPAAPVPGAPVPGAPVPGAPVPGAPVPGAPVPGAPVAGAPVAGAPAPGAPAPVTPNAAGPATPAGIGSAAGLGPPVPVAAAANQAEVVPQVPYPAAPLAANSLTPTQQAVPATPAAPGAPGPTPGTAAAPAANPPAANTAPGPATPPAANPAPPNSGGTNVAGTPADAGPSVLPPVAATPAASTPVAGASGSDPANPTGSTDPGALAPDPATGTPDPATGPLPEATAATSPVAPAPPPGTYQADLGIFRPPANAPPQKIVLEFGGATVEPKKFGMESAATPAQAKLSPLSSFMSGFGLKPADQPALMAKVADTFRKNMTDAMGGGQVDVTTSNAPGTSTFGQPDVSRVVLGGSTKEIGISTVGISESVDPGNFVREETALVLLDRLSGPSNQPVSLTHYLPGTITEAAKIDFVGRALGNIASHEAGHFLGSWHTNAASPKHDLMAPGDVVGAFGFGADKMGGTPDDVATHFGQDTFSPQEGFTGTEDTKTRTTVGLRGAPNTS
jgi:hypothetical protein